MSESEQLASLKKTVYRLSWMVGSLVFAMSLMVLALFIVHWDAKNPIGSLSLRSRNEDGGKMDLEPASYSAGGNPGIHFSAIGGFQGTLWVAMDGDLPILCARRDFDKRVFVFPRPSVFVKPD